MNTQLFTVPTSLWGDVEVNYFRTDDGREGLSVPACKVTAAEWSKRKIGPPPFLMPIDISTSTQWNSYIRQAMLADVRAANPQTAAPVAPAAPARAPDPAPPKPKPIDHGTAMFVDPKEVGGMKPTSPRPRQ